jgi:hypothetical protein
MVQTKEQLADDLLPLVSITMPEPTHYESPMTTEAAPVSSHRRLMNRKSSPMHWSYKAQIPRRLVRFISSSPLPSNLTTERNSDHNRTFTILYSHHGRRRGFCTRTQRCTHKSLPVTTPFAQPNDSLERLHLGHATITRCEE